MKKQDEYSKTFTVHFEAQQYGIWWAVVKICSDGSVVKVTDSIYNKSQAENMAHRLNRD